MFNVFQAILKTNKVLGKLKPGADADDENGNETIHVHMENEETLRSDLEYLAKKLGVNLEELKNERYLKEKAEKEAERIKRIEKKERARLSREKALEELFLKEYGVRFFITLNGERLKRVSKLDGFVCPQCGEALPSIRGWAQYIADVPAGYIFGTTTNPLSVFGAIPCIVTDVNCKNKHKIELKIQQLF